MSNLPIPTPVRRLKHAAFSLLPGRIGLRNRACLRRLRPSVSPNAFRQALERVTPESVCLDCGANLGLYTRPLAERAAKVYAFEPDPWTAARLRENTADLGNVEVIEAAVGASEATIALYRAHGFEADPEGGSVSTTAFAEAATTDLTTRIEVPQIDLIGFIAGLEAQVSILKLDVEGAEVEILERLLDHAALAKLDHVFVETHELHIPPLLERTEALRQRTAGLDRPHIDLDWR
ncbi:MAG: FkbM family methyltransferase [Pseudomonadota bacterium]